MISKYPCYGVRQSFEGTTGPLVSWCLTYEYGAVGMLFTLEVLPICLSDCPSWPPCCYCTYYHTFIGTRNLALPCCSESSEKGILESCRATCSASKLLQIPGIRLHRSQQLCFSNPHPITGIRTMLRCCVGRCSRAVTYCSIVCRCSCVRNKDSGYYWTGGQISSTIQSDFLVTWSLPSECSVCWWLYFRAPHITLQ